MTKAKKITLSVFIIFVIILAVAALALFIWWYIQGRTAMDDAAAQVRKREGMFFVDEGYSKQFVKYELYDDLFGENGVICSVKTEMKRCLSYHRSQSTRKKPFKSLWTFSSAISSMKDIRLSMSKSRLLCWSITEENTMRFLYK